METLHPSNLLRKTKSTRRTPVQPLTKRKARCWLLLLWKGPTRSFKPLLNGSEQDCSLGDNKHPATTEEALQVLSMHEQQTLKQFVKKKPKSDDDSHHSSLLFAQKNQMMKQGSCFKCGKPGHLIKDCPTTDMGTNKKEEKNDVTPEQSHI